MIEENNYYPYAKSLEIVRMITGIISAIPCVFIIVIYFLKKSVRQRFPNTLNCQLCITCTIQSLCYLVYYKNREESKLCHFQGTIITTSYIIALFFSTTIGVTLYLTFIHPDFFNEDSKTKQIILSLIPWILGLIYAILMWLFGWNKEEGGVRVSRPGKTLICWFETDAFYLGNFILDLILIGINAIIIVILIIKILNFLKSDNQETMFRPYFRVLIKFILIQVIAYCPLFVHGVFSIISYTTGSRPKSPPWWVFIRDLIQALTGFLFAVVYGYSNEVKKEVLKWFGVIPEKELSSLKDDEENEVDYSQNLVTIINKEENENDILNK